jgi:hypothetical protein
MADFQNDLVCLPAELQARWSKYQKLLAIDPYHTLGWPSQGDRLQWLREKLKP